MFGAEQISLAFDNRWLIFALAALVVYAVLVLLLYRRTNPPLSAGWKYFLGILRAVALLFAIFCVAEPVFTLQYKQTEKPRIAVLADNSSSLKTVEDFNRKQAFLEELVEGEFNSYFPDDAGVDLFSFSDSLSVDLILDQSGQQTALGNVLLALEEKYRERNLTAVVIASDGLSNFGADPVEAARELNLPIYTVDLGPQQISRDIRIVSVEHDPVAYADRPTDFIVEIEGRGFEQLSLPLTVSTEGRQLIRETVRVLGKGQRQKISLEITPPEPGRHTFSLNLPVQEDEKLSDNNRRSVSLKVLKSKKRILLATDELNWEVTFLKRAITASEDFDLEFVLSRDRGRLDAGQFADYLDSLAVFDLLIFTDCTNNFFVRYLTRLDDYVQNSGGSIWYLQSRGSAGNLPNADKHPAFPYNDSRRVRYFNDFPFHVELTEEGLLHPVTRLSEDSRRNLKLWDEIPPFEEHLQVIEPKTGARILALHPDKYYRDQKLPLIFYHTVGRGKVLTFLTGPLWKLGFLNIGFGGDDQAYRQIVMNSINWLTTREDVEQIRLSPSQQVYKSGERVTFQGVVMDDNYTPLENSVINLVVSPADGDSLVVAMPQSGPGRFSADLGLLPSGKYDYHAEVVWEDKTLKKLDGQFEVEGFSLEEETLFLPPDILQRISQASGGKTYNLADFDQLADDLMAVPRFRIETAEAKLAQSLWVLLIILGFLSLEWILRKRLQLL